MNWVSTPAHESQILLKLIVPLGELTSPYVSDQLSTGVPILQDHHASDHKATKGRKIVGGKHWHGPPPMLLFCTGADHAHRYIFSVARTRGVEPVPGRASEACV